jgi:amidase
MNGIVGVKPTLGLLSGERIVPISHSQDTAGPMTATVMDAALMLTAMAGKQPACTDCVARDYAATLPAASLAGKRIGVLRFKAGRQPAVEPVYTRALEHLRAAGATLVEVDFGDTDPIDAAEDIVLHAEFKPHLNAYLASTPAAVKTRTLADLIAFNASQPRETALFGQEIFERAEKMPGLDDAAYLKALADSKRLAGSEGIDRILKANRLQLLVAPTTGPDWRVDIVNGDNYTGSFSTLPAVAGYPHVTVPMGTIEEMPIGLSFIGTAFSDAQLLEAAYVFEQRSKVRLRPQFIPSIDAGDAATAPL